MKEYLNLKAIIETARQLKQDPASAKANDAMVVKENERLARLAEEMRTRTSKRIPINKAKYMKDAWARNLRDPNPEN